MPDITVSADIHSFMQAANNAAARTALAVPGLAIANVLSVNGSASTPALSLTGAIYTAGSATTAKALLMIEPSGSTSTNWSAGGTALGINANLQGSTTSLLDIQLGGGSNANRLRYHVDTYGYLTLFSSGAAEMRLANYFSIFAIGLLSTANYVGLYSNSATGAGGFLCNSANGATTYFALVHNAAANICQLGLTSATPGNQTFKGPDASGTNIAGGKLCIGPGQSTGNATPATLVLQGTAAGASGSTSQTLVDVLTITNSTTLTFNDATSIIEIATGSTNGLRIAASTSQKLGFFGATPVAQPASVSVALGDAGVGSDTVSLTTLNNTLAYLSSRINEIISNLATLGLQAAF